MRSRGEEAEFCEKSVQWLRYWAMESEWLDSDLGQITSSSLSFSLLQNGDNIRTLGQGQYKEQMTLHRVWCIVNVQ